MSGGVYVETKDLRAKAVQVQNVNFSNSLLDKPIVVPPDVLPLSKSAVDNLSTNASHLYRCQDYGDREGERLAETLESVAAAYDEVDAATRANIDGNGPPAQPVTPKANSIPDPTPPLPMGGSVGISAGGYADVEKTQRDLATGDNAASLRGAAQEWIRNGNALQTSAQTFKEPIQNWEGEAAQQAYQKFNAYGDYLFKLGTSWHQLAGEALRISDAHVKAMFQHTPVYQQYVELKAQLVRAMSLDSPGALVHQINEKMADLQLESDDIRETYAREANPNRIDAPEPPPSSAPMAPVTANGTRPAGRDPGSTSPSVAGGSAGGGGAPRSGLPQTPDTAPVSPMSARQDSKGSPAGAGAPQSGSGGGSPSGGSGSGSGLPSSGLPGGGDTSTDLPENPWDPSVQPAAADVGGGAGGGVGGGGGGVPNMPLQPSVGGVAVGPGPTGGAAGGAAPAAASTAGGGMGGMGGMAPMHGAHGQGGKEKRRTPGLSPDEEIYSEDRPWTEGYIGQPQRKAGQSNKDSS